MSEGIGEARTEAEGELALARIALDDGETVHATGHIANAIASDPTLRDAYELLDQLAAGLVDARALFPDANQLYIGAAAARSYLLARHGAIDEAFGLLCQVVIAEPGKPWAAGWLAAPGASPAAVAGRMSAERATAAIQQLAVSVPDPAGEATAATLEPFLDVARRIARLNRKRADLLPFLSSLARRLGAVDEAIEWCERAERAEPSFIGAVMLGYALREAGRLDEVHLAWGRALSRSPRDVYLRTDIAEQLAREGRLNEGIALLEEGLALEADHPKAFPSACAMRYLRDGDVAHLVRLADWWREHPEHGYADSMLALSCRGRAWLGMVPAPTEAMANILRNTAAGRDLAELGSSTVKLTLSALEVPSAIAAARSALPGLTFAADPPTPTPNIRVPLAVGRYQVWTYVGAFAVPSVPAPSEAAAEALRSAAVNGYPAHPIAAYDAALSLAMVSVADLLGLMSHVPPPPADPGWQRLHRVDPSYWPRSAQAWACLALLHHRADEPWLSSTRRAVLVDLMRGVEDWVTDAAMNALVTAAWADPDVRGDVADLIAQRFLDGMTAHTQREVSIIEPLAHLVLATPVMNPAVADLARQFLQRAAATDDASATAPPA